MSQALAYRQQDDVMDVAELTRRVDADRAKMAKDVDDLVAMLNTASFIEADSVFPGLVKLAQQLLNLDDLEMSRILKTSRPTIGRWVRGVSTPHPLARKAIFDVLVKKARAHAKSLRD